MPPLRILHVTPYSAGAWAYGGIPRLSDSLTRGLAQRGHHVVVCTTDACEATARLRPGAGGGTRLGAWPSRVAAGVQLRVFPNVSNRLAYHLQLFLPLGLNQFLKSHAGAFDVAHLHACRNLPGAIAAYHLRRTGVPYVLAPNGTAPRIERRQLAKRCFDAAAGRRMLSGASRVLAVSNAERTQLRDLGVPPERIRVIPNPIDIGEFTAAIPRGRFRQRVGIPSAPLVLYLGKLTPRKRVDVLARAFARLRRPDARLVIAGNDMGSETELRALIVALGLEQRTVFTGLLRAGERLEALADADVVAYASEHEIFGLVPLEALLAGTPVIVADDSGCAEVVAPIPGGQVVRAGDADALADALERVLCDPPAWRSAAVSSSDQIKRRYGADVVCSQLDGLYREMLAAA